MLFRSEQLGNPHVELELEGSGEEGADTRRAAPNYGRDLWERIGATLVRARGAGEGAVTAGLVRDRGTARGARGTAEVDVRGRRPVRALAFGARHERHGCARGIPGERELPHCTTRATRTRPTQLSKKPSRTRHSTVQRFRKPNLQKVFDEMTRVLHFSEKSQKFSHGLFYKKFKPKNDEQKFIFPKF